MTSVTMNLRRLSLPLLCLCGLALPGSSQAQSASDLGQSLTAVGAIVAGNADGSIPAWRGGLASTPSGISGFKPGAAYPDPYADERPLLTITPDNVDRYEARLTPGEIALLKKYSDYQISVYPTHRTAALPEGFNRDSITNAVSGRAQLAAGNGDGLTGTTSGIPFPIPRNGLEAIWNELTRYRGESYESQNQLAAVTRSGAYNPVSLHYRLKFIYGAQSLPASKRTHNLLLYFIQQVISPSRLAGNIVLVHETLDHTLEPRKAWVYNPGTRRVRLAPDVSYDSPGPASDGLRADDDFGLFNGATDRYTWKLMGKREIYVPYNAYRMTSHALSLKSLLTQHHINTAYARYELHRVWVVEATLKPNYSHIYSRRVFYLDEDSWSPLLDEEYDNRGKLWRVGESHLIQLWDVPMPFSVLEVLTDLDSGRYIASRMFNNSNAIYLPKEFGASDFTPDALRGLGLR